MVKMQDQNPKANINEIVLSPSTTETSEYSQSGNSNIVNLARDRMLPYTSQGDIYCHTYYCLSYVEKYEQAEWVAYPLSKSSLQKPNVPRTDYFDDDLSILTKSSTFYDYKSSGYTKGHLAPAADMAFSEEAMKECFLMSNMSPQLRAFNGGVWRELEEQTRDWAYNNNSVYIVTGPILDSSTSMTIKGIGIPSAFYKIILDLEEPEVKAIAFVIPHEKSIRPLQDYAVSIAEVEKQTGIDFFPIILNDNQGAKIESTFDINKWKFSESRFNLRVTKWNNQ
jgi:endonuclease G